MILTFEISNFLNLLVFTIQKVLVLVMELRQKMTVFSSFNFEKKFHKVCNTMASYISCFLLPIVSTIFENIKFRFYLLHNLDMLIFPKMDRVTELHEFGNGITL